MNEGEKDLMINELQILRKLVDEPVIAVTWLYQDERKLEAVMVSLPED